MACCDKAKIIATGFKNLAVDKFVGVNKFAFTDRRIRTCQKCEDNQWFGRRLFCKHCGCFIPAKARVPGEKCPLEKWES